MPKSPEDPLWKTEMFAPILNVAIFDKLEQAIEWNNAVPQVCPVFSVSYFHPLIVLFQGLSSSLWTRDLRHMGTFIVRSAFLFPPAAKIWNSIGTEWV